MKAILKVSILATLLALTSCAHHRKCCGKCDHKEGKSEQCPMKSGEAAKAEETPAAKK